MLMKFLATQERMNLGKVTFWLCTTNITSSEVVRPYNKQEGKQKANVSMGQYFYAGSRTYEANRGMRNRDKPSQLEYQLYTS